MTQKTDQPDALYCHFCGRNQRLVETLLATEEGVRKRLGHTAYICGDCVQEFHEILANDEMEVVVKAVTPNEWARRKAQELPDSN